MTLLATLLVQRRRRRLGLRKIGDAGIAFDIAKRCGAAVVDFNGAVVANVSRPLKAG